MKVSIIRTDCITRVFVTGSEAHKAYFSVLIDKYIECSVEVCELEGLDQENDK